MRTLRPVITILCAFALLGGVSLVRAAEPKEPCCAATVEAGKKCKHECCAKAANAGKVCEKCHPKKAKK